MNEQTILDNAFEKALKFINSGKYSFSETIKTDVDLLIEKIDSNKSLVSALVTSLVKKILTPEQDIRYHRTDFENGYSARVLDTKYTSPFFKRHFPKYANKESAFLTLATREKIEWTISEGGNLKIRSKNLKESFLNIFDQIETHRQNPEKYLHYIFIKLIELSKKDEQIFQTAKFQSFEINTLNINIILEMLNLHFSEKLSSRLPVVAIYSIYEILMPILKRYNGKYLVDLQVHTSSDKHGYGDIEINHNNNAKPFEIVEIKHNIPITEDLIFDIAKKTENTEISRYYILTTYDKGFENNEVEEKVNNFIMQIKANRNIDIIANGILTTLKYYLRFIDDYNLFVKTYTNNLINDAKNSTEIKDFHIKSWTSIMKKYKLKKIKKRL